MIKEDIVDDVARELGIPKHESLQVVDSIIEQIKEILEEGDKIEIREFGTFRPVLRKKKLGRIIATGETVEIPSRMAPKFVPGRILKKLVMESAEITTEDKKQSDNAASEQPEARENRISE